MNEDSKEQITLFDFLAGCALAGLVGAMCDLKKDEYVNCNEAADFSISYAESLYKKIIERRGNDAG